MSEETTNQKPAIYRWFLATVDGAAAIVILAFAIMGASEKIRTASTDVRIGAACIVVGLLAVRLVERLFENRKR